VSVAEVLSVDRVARATEAVNDKSTALERLATMLTAGDGQTSSSQVFDALLARERLQSTGVGGGVAVPHGSLDSVDRHIGALLICPRAIEFDAIDGEPVTILFALIGPKGAPAQHLKILARVSRLLKHEDFRARLLSAPASGEIFDMICETEPCA
jgi:PTS system nitrogen regulatory IIA component